MHFTYLGGRVRATLFRRVRYLVTNPAVVPMQVGVGVNSDFGRLANDYGVKAKAGMDLAVASRRYLSRSLLGTGSLSSLCSELLQRDLPKPQSILVDATAHCPPQSVGEKEKKKERHQLTCYSIL